VINNERWGEAVGWLRRASVTTSSAQLEESPAAVTVTHWRTLRERFESRMRGLESELHGSVRGEAIATERCYTRERLAAL